MQTSKRRLGMFSLQCREEEETSDLRNQGLMFSTLVNNPEAFCSCLRALFSFSNLRFALHRASHLPQAYAPYDPPKRNGSAMPIRLAQLKSAALEPGVEIQGPHGTLRAAWTQRVMERFDQFNMGNSKITCKVFLQMYSKPFLMVTCYFGIIC